MFTHIKMNNFWKTELYSYCNKQLLDVLQKNLCLSARYVFEFS